MKAIIFFVFFSLVQNTSFAEVRSPSKKIPDEIQLFAEKNSIIIDWKSADLNGDGLDDYLVVLEIQKKNTSEPDMNDKQRPVLLLIRQQDGSLKLVKRNDQIVSCSTCGGTFDDGFSELVASNRAFSISNHTGGTSAQTTDVYFFGYSRRDSTWQLVRVETKQEELFKKAEYKYVMTPPSDFGKIDFENFDAGLYLGQGEGYILRKKKNI